MRITIKISTSSQAYEDDPAGELRKMLHGTTEAAIAALLRSEPQWQNQLVDSNGNGCGFIRIDVDELEL